MKRQYSVDTYFLYFQAMMVYPKNCLTEYKTIHKEFEKQRVQEKVNIHLQRKRRKRRTLGGKERETRKEGLDRVDFLDKLLVQQLLFKVERMVERNREKIPEREKVSREEEGRDDDDS